MSAPGNGAFAATFDGNSSDGSRVFFHSREKLVAGDTDASADVYERSGGTTKLVIGRDAGQRRRSTRDTPMPRRTGRA